MDLRQTRTFVTIAELGTVSKAAAHLHLAQSALSRQLGALEQEFGLRLFDRVGRGLVLSAEGEQLLAGCRGLLAHADSLGEQAQLLRRGDAGTLKVAASPQYIEHALADFIPRFAESFPAVHVKLTEAIGWPEIRSLIDRGDIHLGQNLAHAVAADDQRYASLPVGFVEQRAVWSPALRLVAKGSIEIERLSSHSLLLLDTGYIFRQTFDAACRLAKVAPTVVFESRTPHTLLTMAERGHGVAVVPSTLRTDRYRLRTTSVVHNGRPLREAIAMFWDSRRPLPNYAAAFCKMLAARAPDTRADRAGTGRSRNRPQRRVDAR